MGVLGSLRKIVTIAALASLMSGAAMADIRAFNEAMLAKDYKKAALEAASYWPMLDRSRTDIAAIAREFGTAAFMAGDFSAARDYGKVAVEGSARVKEAAAERIASDIVLRLAEHRLAPTQGTRDQLFASVEESSRLPGIDLLSFLGADAVVSFDTENSKWKAARISAALAEKLTGQGGPGYATVNLQFGFIRAVAAFSIDRNIAAYDDIVKLKARITEAINQATTVERAMKLVPIYWNAGAWRMSAQTYFGDDRRLKVYEANAPAEPELDPVSPGAQLILRPKIGGTCQIQMRKDSPRPRFPPSALNKGMIGTIMLELDIDADGHVTDASVLAAAPGKYFGDSALQSAREFVFEPAPTERPGCTMAQTDMVFTLVFSIKE